MRLLRDHWPLIVAALLGLCAIACAVVLVGVGR